MSITPNPDASFIPSRGHYTDLKPFRFWCQKVLPLVYDDSLSYYELLCKVVDYLNKTMEDVETLEGDVTAMYTAYEQLQSYVNTYFDSLDVQEEINNKLDAMAASGELLTIIQPTISAATANWLSQHITNPSNPPIDTSLTVAGSAADAKATGDKIKDINTNLKIFNLFDLLANATFEDKTVDGVTYTWSGRTVTMSGTATSASFNNLILSQSALPDGFIPNKDFFVQWLNNKTYLNFLWYNNGALIENKYIRGANVLKVPSNATGLILRIYIVEDVTINASVTPVVETVGENNNLKYYGALAETSYTVNTVPNQSIFLLTNTGSESPIANTSAWLVTVGGTLGMQIWIATVNGRMYYRYRDPDFVYGDWRDQVEIISSLAKSVCFKGGYSGDLNSAPINNIVVDTGSCPNSPKPNYAGYVITIGTYDSSYIQIWIQYGNGTTYFRRGLDGNWFSWLNMGSGGGGGNAYAKLFSLGNSIMTGSVYLNGNLDHLCQYGNAPYSCVADAIGIKEANVSHTLHSSTGILYDAGQGSFKDTILATNLEGYDYVLTHFWLADMENYQIGTLNSTANDGTLVGAILAILAHMRTSNGKAKLLLASVPPASYTIYGNNVFTGVYANGSSIAQLDTVMYQLAEREHFIYVDFQKWNMSYYYQDFTDGQNVHLNSDAGYRAMGTYLGGRFSSEINYPPIDTSLSVGGAPADAKATGDEISALKADFTQLQGNLYTEANSANLLYLNTVKQNYYISSTNGQEMAYNNWGATDYIPITPGENYVFIGCYSASGTYENIRTDYYAFYDREKAFISGGFNSKGVITAPPNAAYIRESTNLPAFTSAMYATMFGLNSDIGSFIGQKTKDGYIEPKTEFIPSEFLKNTVNNIVDHTIRVETDGTGDFATLKDAVEYSATHEDTTIIVGNGTYNLITEFGSSYFENMTTSNQRQGLQIGNGVHIIFSSGSKVTAHYTGDNDAVKTCFSPFNFIQGSKGFILENLTLEASNVRYAVHDEAGNTETTNHYKNVYKNCNMTIDNSQNASWLHHQCIGGGLGLHGEIIIEDCIFTDLYNINYRVPAVSYHNSAGAEAKSRIVIKGCWFSKDATVRISWYGTSTAITEAIVHDNSVTVAPYANAEATSATVENVKLFAWNNEIREA